MSQSPFLSPDRTAVRQHVFENVPTIEFSDRKYTVRFARNEQDLDAVLKLRYEVFNLELGEGLERSHSTQRDMDEFDLACHHLLVLERGTGVIIGTYRMQTLEMTRGKGFYSSTEFDMSTLPPEVVHNAVEVGRACIAKAHRNGRVLFLLWRGLAQYMTAQKKRYLFGCCSLTSQNPAEGKAVMDHLQAHNYVLQRFAIRPQPGYECYSDGFTVKERVQVKIPRLFRIYLNYGAKVCGPPAIDRLFKTIDYFVILDIAGLDQKTIAMFF